MRREIERRLDLIGRIKYEPKLMPDTGLPETTNADTICRMQAMDDFKILGIIILFIQTDPFIVIYLFEISCTLLY